MKKKEQLYKLIQEYRKNPTDLNTNFLDHFLKTNTLYFNYYFNDTEGLSKVSYASNNNGTGKFVDFITSKNYPNPYNLLIVSVNDESTEVFVSIDALSFDDE